MDVVFTHRPQLGVSVGGFQSSPNEVVLAIAITNTDAGDVYNRSIARSIVRSRIRDRVEGRHERLHFSQVVTVPEGVTAADVINQIRSFFKPDPDEQDDTFFFYTDNPATSVSERIRMNGDEIWSTVLRNVDVDRLTSLRCSQ